LHEIYHLDKEKPKLEYKKIYSGHIKGQIEVFQSCPRVPTLGTTSEWLKEMFERDFIHVWLKIFVHVNGGRKNTVNLAQTTKTSLENYQISLGFCSSHVVATAVI
jgi:hypothetical protein